ncbi:TolC family protein [Chloroherpeton thalassium]|nr:TolC family protein [Chloroherpeton thalassium]
MRYPFKASVLVGFLLFFSTQAFGQSPSAAKTLTLKECIRIALKNATSVQKAENSYALTGAQVLSSYGQFLPSLSVSSSYTFYSNSNDLQQTALNEVVAGDTLSTISTSVVSTKSRSARYSISSSLNLFNGFSDYASLKQSLRNEDAAKYSLARAKEQIAFDVAQAYLQVLLNQELLKISQETYTSSQEQLQQIAAQVKIGAKAEADLYQQEAEVSSDELSVIDAENTLRSSKIDLLVKLRLNPRENYEFFVPATDTTELDSQYRSLDWLVAEAIESRSDLKSAKFSMEAYDWSITGAKSDYYPSLNLNFSYGSSGTLIDDQTIDGTAVDNPSLANLFDQLKEQTSTSIALGLSWTIFDGFSRNLSVQQAKVNYQNSRLDYEDLKLDVISEVTQAFGDYNAALKKLESTRKGLTSAEKAYETVNERYKIGSATFVELSSSRATLVTAQANRAQAEFNFTFQKKILAYYIGAVDIDTYFPE